MAAGWPRWPAGWPRELCQPQGVKTPSARQGLAPRADAPTASSGQAEGGRASKGLRHAGGYREREPGAPPANARAGARHPPATVCRIPTPQTGATRRGRAPGAAVPVLPQCPPVPTRCLGRRRQRDPISATKRERRREGAHAPSAPPSELVAQGFQQPAAVPPPTRASQGYGRWPHAPDHRHPGTQDLRAAPPDRRHPGTPEGWQLRTQPAKRQGARLPPPRPRRHRSMGPRNTGQPGGAGASKLVPQRIKTPTEVLVCSGREAS
eukprot:15454621-Alexandrium_andersonii.AAC.1